ncbi:helix-turn-helix domain-containing protein [Propionimicrobium lymphophilum]|uniref:helix-turn-helix domain-containing protein n=1 Tax=Propionimicrobium lymphophilum TaxID=33012 RepID=UPI003B82F159
MNQLDRLRITNLRANGWGYKKIADFCGISRDQVRAYCTKHNLSAEGETQERVCEWCGRELTSVDPRARFCSSACRHQSWRAGLHRPKTCQACGQTFNALDKPGQQYCSHACYVRSRFGTRGGRK